MARFDASAYGSKDVPPETLLHWWRAFPVGVRIAENDCAAILGAMSAWPLLPNSYQGIAGGMMQELHLGPEHFDLTSTQKPRWYISGIAIDTVLRTSARFMLAFLLDGLAQLRAEARVDAPDVCAVATSSEGARMLSRFGFERRASTSHGLVFERRAFADSRLATLAAAIA